MSTLAQASFAGAVLLSSLITMSCFKPPNEVPRDGWKQDSLSAYGSPTAARIRRILAVSVGVFHALIALGYSDSSLLCPHPENLNKELFSWNPYTSGCLALVIFIGGPLRLTAFAQLGSNFTFQLGPPDTLMTEGMYRYVQHPGYTGQILVLIVNLALFLRWDGAFGCWLPHDMRMALNGWGLPISVVLVLGIIRRLLMRVRDEEKMLKETFGEKWVAWHRVTKRFVPGII
ncbi:prenyl cysteine carboxyl methyltransferase [Fusarium beomiforme]|uniref:Protein-S-isoprenylcysteine O-methyltransferase n=1 Tax=Fusarium beomiforme TaxID=44412 RepID=A0A9P5DX40_9HYPO|nr:prenyl cysteine carboxyl methyltransferase [Fusarium beomiforme]